MTIKLAAALPKTSIANGLLTLDEDDLENGGPDVIIVARLRPKQATHTLAGFEGDDVVQLAAVAIEPLAGAHRDQALDLLAEANAIRTGRPQLEPVVGPFHVTCEECDGAGEITAWFEEHDWERTCPACDDGRVEIPVADVARVVVGLLCPASLADPDVETEAA